MSSSEKIAWINAIAFLLAYGWYIQHILSSSSAGGIAHTPYLGSLIVTTVVSTVLVIIGQIVVAIITRERQEPADVRDKSVFRRAAYSSHFILYVGGIGVMALALLDVDRFWIGNAMYLTMFLGAWSSEIFRIVYYRRGLPAW